MSKPVIESCPHCYGCAVAVTDWFLCSACGMAYTNYKYNPQDEREYEEWTR